MSGSFPNTFITAFEREVVHDYQLMGGQLRKAVNHRSISDASQARINRIGTGVAQQKGRHADVPIMNLAHSTETVTLADWFAAEYVDSLDELKSNVNYREDIKKAIIQALGRREDTIILDAWVANVAAAATATVAAGAGLTLADLTAQETALAKLNVAQSDRVAVVSHDFANRMRSLDEVVNGDYVDGLKWENAPEGFMWHGHPWIVYNGLPLAGATRTNFLTDKNNTAFRVLKDITMSVDPVPEKDATLLKGKMSMGARHVQDDGIAAWTITE